MLQTFSSFASQYISARRVDIWLPPGYAAAGDVCYPVIYCQDGQNLFQDAHAAFGTSWGVPETMTRLIEGGTLPPSLIVGVWSTHDRWREYAPAAPFAGAGPLARRMRTVEGGPPLSDAYLRFLVDELKPQIDAKFRTVPAPHHTAIMGASMGGLCSAYALCRYPDVFGAAACLSTHWPVFGTPQLPHEDYRAAAAAVIDYFGTQLPRAGRHRLYFDLGTADLDAYYPPFQAQMDERLRALGYRPEVDWVTRTFPGATHHESAWRDRLPLPLAFLLLGRLLDYPDDP